MAMPARVANDAEKRCRAACITDLRLHTWLSASFPTGAFSYSQGLESAIVDGHVHDRESTKDWLSDVLLHGSGRNDTLLFAASWRCVRVGSVQELSRHNDLALALCAGKERQIETCAQGEAFCRAMQAWPTAVHQAVENLRPEIALPVAVGALTATHGAPLERALSLHLQAGLSNLAWIAARLIPLGQTDCLAVIADLEDMIVDHVQGASTATLDDIGGFALVADLASIRHEQLRTRICQT